MDRATLDALVDGAPRGPGVYLMRGRDGEVLDVGKARAIRFSTLSAICRKLDCAPGDILEYREEDPSSE